LIHSKTSSRSVGGKKTAHPKEVRETVQARFVADSSHKKLDKFLYKT
jgi:hypothetical protein